MREGNRSGVTSSRVAKLALGLIGTLVLGAMGSGLWEIVFRPGLTRFGDFLISLSASANSAVYTTAALDPTPVPGLVVLLLLVQIPALIAMWFIHLGFVKPLIERRLEADFERIRSAAADLPDGDDIVARNLRRRLRITACVGAAIMLLFSSVTIYAYTIENKAVILWRVFHQNLDICRPYISQDEAVRLLASFRSMHDERDFSKVRDDMNFVASKNHILLNWRGAE